MHIFFFYWNDGGKMKCLKIFFWIITFIVLSSMLFAFIVSFSFEDMYYNEKDDSLIVLKNNGSFTNYTYSINNHTEKGNVIISNKGITFVKDDKEVAVAIYNKNSKDLIITGSFLDNKYKDEKFSQLNSVFTYLKAMF